MTKKSVIVVDNYDSFTWNLVHYLEEIGASTHVVRNDEYSVEDVLGRTPDGIVLSPGPCTPNEAGICVELIQQAPESMPILGVCLGHQSIGQAYGGTIQTAQEIRHGKLSDLTHNGSLLFDGLPETFSVVRYHSLSILTTSLPNCLTTDAQTPDGEIMAVHHVDRPVFGVQFHPESILTEHGHAMLQN